MKLKSLRSYRKSTLFVAALGSLGVLAGATVTGYELTGSNTHIPTGSASVNSVTLSSGSVAHSTKHRHRHPYQVVSSYYLKKKGTTVVVTRDLGTYVAASSSQVTINLPTGKDLTFAVTPSTKFKGVPLGALENDLAGHIRVRGTVVTVGTQLKLVRSHVVHATAGAQTAA